MAKAGDAILLPTPWYFNHEMTLKMLGIEAVPLPCRAENGFVPDIRSAEKIITARKHAKAKPLRAIVLVTPNNPTGAVYPPGVIAQFSDLASKNAYWLILDETYRDFRPTPEAPPHRLFQSSEQRENLIQLYSFSKSYAIPGHRLGALLAPSGIEGEVSKILDSLQICAPRIGQIALAWAIDGMKQWRAENAADIAERGDTFRASMQAAAGWEIISMGAYFAFVKHPFVTRHDAEVAERLAREFGVLGLPGSFFGSDRHAVYPVRLRQRSTGAHRSYWTAFKQIAALGSCTSGGARLLTIENALAVQDVEARSDHDGRPNKSVVIRHVAKYKVSEKRVRD